MNILNKYIDYSIIAKNSPEDWEKGLLVKQSKNSYVDKEIKKYQEICESDYKSLKKLTKEKFQFYSKSESEIKIGSCNESNIMNISEIIYSQNINSTSDINNTIMFKINITWSYCWEITLIGIIDAINDKFFILGCNCAHPFLFTNNFSYYNSDGS